MICLKDSKGVVKYLDHNQINVNSLMLSCCKFNHVIL